MNAPFPYFGGKTAVAADVWAALGQPAHYIEPFFGSGAVLLNRPNYDQQQHVETINDADGHVANVWRALQADPEAVARACDWPVNHDDLTARKKELNERKDDLSENLCADHKYYDVELAGYWVWAASCWIGSGLVRPGKIPHIGNAGMGVHKKGQIPHIGNAGMGVHKKGQRPHISDAGMGVQEPYNINLFRWFRQLSERLRYVRVVCGDWSRVCGGKWQANLGLCGMFFDPPYGAKATRTENLYSQDSATVSDDVRAWCLDRGTDEKYRIVLAGYYEEHAELLEQGWAVKRWVARSGYGNLKRNEDSEARGSENRKREALFMSPHCIGSYGGQGSLSFDD